MRLSRFLLIVVLVTVVALGYVYQQVELLRINYTINRNKDNLSVLLDQNSTLMYNVVLEAEDVSVEIPSYWHTVAFAEAEMVK